MNGTFLHTTLLPYPTVTAIETTFALIKRHAGFLTIPDIPYPIELPTTYPFCHVLITSGFWLNFRTHLRSVVNLTTTFCLHTHLLAYLLLQFLTLVIYPQNL